MEPVVIKRVLPCSKRRLFELWSQPALVARWFFASQQPRRPSTFVNSFTVGGQYELVMHLESGDFRHHGEYCEINRYNHISFTWNSHIVQDSLVALDFRELSPNRTEMTLTHSRFPDDDIRARHEGGWSRCFDNLESVATGPSQECRPLDVQ